MKFVKWKFRKKMERYEGKHFSGRRNGLNFKKYKSYRLLLYRNTSTYTKEGGVEENPRFLATPVSTPSA
jgi:hypothetical protein